MNEFMPYQEENCFFITYPTDWECTKQKSSESTMIMFRSPRANATDMFAENVNVLYGDVLVSLDHYVADQITTMKQVPGLEIISRNDTQCAGLPAVTLEFTGFMGPIMINDSPQMVPMHWLQTYLQSGNRMFCITYTAQPESYSIYLPQVEQMLASLILP